MSYLPTSLLREFAWRAGRKLYCYARNEPANNPAINGEYWLFKRYVELTSSVNSIFDIGANKGEWTQNAFDTLRDACKHASIHAFEPTRAAQEFLAKRFSGYDEINLVNAAVTETSGKTDVFVVAPCAGTNSRHPEPGSVSESVASVSVDHYCAINAISRLGFVKSDVEGFDMDVLRGANEILKEGLCDVWQFEYNHRWINNRSFLKDVFEFVKGKPYTFGKLYRNGIDFYDHWHPELDRFFECNCVLIKNGHPIEKLGNRAMFTKSNAVRYE